MVSRMDMFLPTKLRAIRAEQELSLEGAAGKIGISQVMLADFERGISHPRPHLLDRIADAYGCSYEDLWSALMSDIASVLEKVPNFGGGGDGGA